MWTRRVHGVYVAVTLLIAVAGCDLSPRTWRTNPGNTGFVRDVEARVLSIASTNLLATGPDEADPAVLRLGCHEDGTLAAEIRFPTSDSVGAHLHVWIDGGERRSFAIDRDAHGAVAEVREAGPFIATLLRGDILEVMGARDEVATWSLVRIDEEVDWLRYRCAGGEGAVARPILLVPPSFEQTVGTRLPEGLAIFNAGRERLAVVNYGPGCGDDCAVWAWIEARQPDGRWTRPGLECGYMLAPGYLEPGEIAPLTFVETHHPPMAPGAYRVVVDIDENPRGLRLEHYFEIEGEPE